MKILLTIYKDNARIPYEKLQLNAEDEVDIALVAQDMETYLLNAFHEMRESDV